ncbi:MAG: thioredoxin [Papillibacter sp.]|nr:thioredoxin [Papillibacter sp.]
MSAFTIDTNNFNNEVLNSDKPVLVDFWASWCGPCRMLAPIVEEIAAEYEGKVKVGKINIDEQPQLAAKYNVASIPTLILFKDGKPVNTSVGVKPKRVIEAMLG